MSLVYTITIVPVIVGSLAVDSVENHPDKHENMKIVNITKSALLLFYICSSVVNPVITIMGKPDYKNSLCDMIGWNKKKGEGNTDSQSEST